MEDTLKIELVLPPEEDFSWTEELSKIKKGKFMRTLSKYRPSIAPLLSREMKIKTPGREFRTDLKSEPGYLLVHRIK